MGRRLTVVQLLPAMEAGGVERSTLEIAEALVRAGHRAIVVSKGGRLLPALQATGAEHIQLDIGAKSFATLARAGALRRILVDAGADIVHARSRLPAWLGRWALRGIPEANRPRWVTTMHGLNSPSRYSAVMASGERVICVSRAVRDYLLRHYPRTDPGRLRVIERGIDPARFPRRAAVDRPARAVLSMSHPELASFSPFLLFAAHHRWGVKGWLIASLVAGTAILLAGSRASWLTYGLVLLFSGWHVLGWKRLLRLFAAGVLALGLLSMVYAPLGDRIERTAQVLRGTDQGVDAALSGRGKIWGAAGCMIRQHPVNGVGVRDFREAYPACDPSPGLKPAWGEGPALHAHQLLLEILSETGVIGLLMWLAGAALAWRAWRYASAEAKRRARPAMLALAVTVFPFNTHLAFYGSFWGGVTLLLAALYAGSLLARDEPAA